MDTLEVHPRLAPGSFLNYSSPFTTDMSRHIDWFTKDDAILDEPLTTPSFSHAIVRIDNVQTPHARTRFVIMASDYLTVTVRDFLAGLNVYLHHVPGTGSNADAAPEYRLADARALAETQYDVEAAFACFPELHEDLRDFPPKSITLPGLAVSERDFRNQKPHSPIHKRAVVQWLQGRSMFAGVKADRYNEAELVVRMVKPEEVGVFSYTLCMNAAKGHHRIVGPA